MRAIVTGAAGFIGSHVVLSLLEAGWEVLGIDDLTGGFRENVHPDAEFRKVDCLQPVDDLFGQFRPKAVFHLAAYAAEGLSHHIPVFNYQNNIVATANVLSATYRCSAEHFVFTSSIAAYGHPIEDKPLSELDYCVPCDPYGTAKLACEHHIRAFFRYFGGPTYSIFRPHNVFGPHQNVSDPYRNVVGIFIRCALAGQPMPIFGDGSQSRSFSHIGPVARCIAESAWTEAAKNETFNVGGDQPMTVLELGKLISRLAGVDENFKFLAPRKEVLHAHATHEKVHRAFPDACRSGLSIEAGLRETIEYVKAHPIPDPTACPSEIEIRDQLPESWS